MRKTIAVLFGGVSPEHEVSLVSAGSVINNIPREKYEVLPVGITRQGNWYAFLGDLGALADSSWEQDKENLTPCFPVMIDGKGAFALFKADGVSYAHIDCVFPALHGKNGEDGTVQGLLQLVNIPCVGCDMASSAICMDKAVSNALADANGIAGAQWLSITKPAFDADPSAFVDACAQKLGYPCFVKPANCGSSVGISKAKSREQLLVACQTAFEHDRKLVVEEFIDGQEVETAVMGNEQPVVSVVGEIIPCNEFYDYEAKYISGDSELIIPARLSQEKRQEVRTAARKAFGAFDCAGMARIDFFVRKSDGKVFLNEINTIPGFTSISMYAKLFEADGVPYPEILDRLITCAMEKAL